MSQFTVTHELECESDAFWSTFFDVEFNKRLYSDVLGFPEFAIVEQRESDGEIVRVVQAQPKFQMQVPSALRTLLGPRFRYTERGRFDKASQTFSWTVASATLTDRTKNEGTMRLEPIGDKRWRWVTDFVVEANVLGFGGLMESLAEKQLRTGWNAMAACLRDSLASRA